MAFVFFTSYSKSNRTRAFERFVELLRRHVFQSVDPAIENESDVTFFAPSTLEIGDEWKPRLVDALRSSKVIVCFCSPHYFASKYCGREFKLFQQRRDAWVGTPGNEHRRARVIFPILWVKAQAQMPQVVQRYQYDEVLFPRKYKDHGLLPLVELRKERDNVKQVAIELAKAIAAAINETSLPELRGPLAIDDIPSSFHEAAEGGRYQQILLCLDSRGWDWTPFEAGLAVSAIVQAISGASSRLYSEIPPSGCVVAHLSKTLEARQAVIVLCEPSALSEETWAPLWQYLENSHPENCGVLVVWRSPPSAADMQLFGQTLARRLPSYG